MNIKFESKIDPQIKRLILKILRINPDQRISVNKILTSKVFIPYLIKFNEPHLIADPLESKWVVLLLIGR